MVRLGMLVLVLPALLGAVPPVIDRPVVDPGGVLSPAQQRTVATEVERLREATGAQLAVVVVDSTQGEPLEDYAMRTAEAWKGGRKGEDKGLLLVLAVGDRRTRLDVGYGLEARLPDDAVKRLLDAQRPLLREQDYTGALIHIVHGVQERLSGVSVSPVRAAPVLVKSEQQASHEALVVLFVLLWVGLGGLAYLHNPDTRQRLGSRARVGGTLALGLAVLGIGGYVLAGQNVAVEPVLICVGCLAALVLASGLVARSGKWPWVSAIALLAMACASVQIGVMKMSVVASTVLVFILPLSALIYILPLSMIGPGQWVLGVVHGFIGGRAALDRWNQQAIDNFPKRQSFAGPVTISASRASGSSWSSSSSSDSSSVSSSSDSSWSSSSSSDSSSSSSSSDSSWSGDGGGFGGGGSSSDW